VGKDDHESEAYRKINPSASIPTLVIETEGEEAFTICQSVAILEYCKFTASLHHRYEHVLG
jgi:maleylacetoacetate isomerase